jgi:hypothetical protein
MTPGVPWVAAYAALVVLSIATVMLRPEPTLLRGRTLFLFTAVYVALAWGWLAWRGGPPTPQALAIGGAALIVSAAATPWWFVFGGARTVLISTIEVCFGRVCAQFERTHSGFMMTVPGGGMHVRMHTFLAPRVTMVSFRTRPAHRKGQLFQRLLLKQYRGVLPTIRIRIG